MTKEISRVRLGRGLSFNRYQPEYTAYSFWFRYPHDAFGFVHRTYLVPTGEFVGVGTSTSYLGTECLVEPEIHNLAEARYRRWKYASNNR